MQSCYQMTWSSVPSQIINQNSLPVCLYHALLNQWGPFFLLHNVEWTTKKRVLVKIFLNRMDLFCTKKGADFCFIRFICNYYSKTGFLTTSLNCPKFISTSGVVMWKSTSTLISVDGGAHVFSRYSQPNQPLWRLQ